MLITYKSASVPGKKAKNARTTRFHADAPQKPLEMPPYKVLRQWDRRHMY